MTTEQYASKYGVKPNTIRASLCKNGHYMGIKPVKLPNRLLWWPDDEVESLLADSPHPESAN
jgi:hypothetical protein